MEPAERGEELVGPCQPWGARSVGVAERSSAVSVALHQPGGQAVAQQRPGVLVE
jgi:hypothetical protein